MNYFKVLFISLCLLLIGVASPEQANAQCPAYGADSTCGAVITVTTAGASVSLTGQGPYDGNDDTMVGVVNNSSLPVYQLILTSPNDIFGFDGDGVDVYGAPGNSYDTTGYGGPNTYFTNLSADLTTGTVNFVTPLQPGTSTYFSLENALASNSATACTTILNGSITQPPGGGTQITSTFTPNNGYTLAQAAQICGFIEFDWQQTINALPLPSPFFAAGSTTPLHAPPSFNDPPPNGYAYQSPPNAVQLPVYWNLFTPASDPLSLAANETATSLFFGDGPADPCLPGGSGAFCGGKTALPGSKLAFTTHLVGVQGQLPGASIVDTGIGFSWTDTFNGTSGEIAVTNSTQPVDPNTGTGGVTVTSFNNISTLPYTGVSVISVNGMSTGSGPLPNLLYGNGCNGTYTGNFVGLILVESGQSCNFVNGNITGGILQLGGSLALANTFVTGPVLVSSAKMFAIGPFSEIDGEFAAGFNINGEAGNGNTAYSALCDSTITGNVLEEDSAFPLQIGGPSSGSCGGNVIGKNLAITFDQVTTSIDSNTVGGSLFNIGNSAASTVTNNTVGKDILCFEDAAITGSGNTAKVKGGQCSKF